VAISLVRQLTANTSSSATTLVYTVVSGSEPVAGNLLVLSAVTSGSRTISSIVDSRSNTYATADLAAFGTSCTGFVAYSMLTTSLQVGDTITITWSSTANSAVNISEWSGIATSSPLDQHTNNNSIGTNSVSTFSVGPTGTTAQADELVIAAFGYVGSNSGTAGSGYTLLTRVQSTGTNRSVHAEYQIVAATGAQTATMDINVASSGGTGMAIATFKAAAGGTPATANAGVATATGTAYAATGTGMANAGAGVANATAAAYAAIASGAAGATAGVATATGTANPATASGGAVASAGGAAAVAVAYAANATGSGSATANAGVAASAATAYAATATGGATALAGVALAGATAYAPTVAAGAAAAAGMAQALATAYAASATGGSAGSSAVGATATLAAANPRGALLAMAGDRAALLSPASPRLAHLDPAPPRAATLTMP